MAEGKAARIFSIVELLVSHALDGMSNADLADKLGTSRSNVSRDLATLIDAGWAEQLSTGRFVITPRLVGMLKAYNLALSAAQERIDSFQARSDALARQFLPRNNF